MKKVMRLPMEKRLAIAKERRKEQLQWYYAREMEDKARMKDSGRIGSGKRRNHKKVQFESTSVLFSLVSEGDVEGGSTCFLLFIIISVILFIIISVISFIIISVILFLCLRSKLN